MEQSCEILIKCFRFVKQYGKLSRTLYCDQLTQSPLLIYNNCVMKVNKVPMYVICEIVYADKQILQFLENYASCSY